MSLFIDRVVLITAASIIILMSYHALAIVQKLY